MSDRKIDYGLALICAALALSPLCLYRAHFEALFWFGDELDLLLQLKREGLAHWTLKTFGENFVPVFKLAWFGTLVVTGGSYFGVISALWITHAVNTLLIWLLIRSCGGTRFACTVCALTFGMSATTLESLSWSVQWSAVLATMFTLIALLVYPKDGSAKRLILFLDAITGAAFCFSRGILASVVGALFPIFWPGLLRWWILSGLILIPAIITSLMISLGATGNHHQLLSGDFTVLSNMAQFGAHSFSLNPLYQLFRFSEISWGAVALLGALKVIIFGAGLCIAYSRSSNLFKICIVLIIFDLLNGTILGIGRHHTGLPFSVSSRYQYEYLVTLSPFIGIIFDAALSLIRMQGTRVILQVLFLSAWAYWIASPWKQEIREWSKSRGKDGRHLLLEQHITDPSANGTKLWWGVPPTISLKDAYEVVEEYELH